MKELLKRQYVFETKNTTEWLEGYFKPEVQNSKEQLIYSRCDEQGNVINGESNCYHEYELLCGKKVMFRNKEGE